MKRPLAILTVGSLAICLVVGILQVLSYHLRLVKYDRNNGRLMAGDSFAITSHFHVGFENGAVWFFSHKFPYTGSMLTIGGRETRRIARGFNLGTYGFGEISYIRESGDVADMEKACDLPGVYFRHFVLHDQADSLWTLMVSLWYAILVLAVLPLLWLLRRGRLLFRKP